MIGWISASDVSPAKSGMYLTATKAKCGEYIYAVNAYSARHEAWNAHDRLDNAENAVKVDFWMPFSGIHPEGA